MRPRSPLFSSVIFLALGAITPIWANSVDVSANSYPSAYTPGSPITSGHTQCAQSGTSSASCEAYFSSIYVPRIDGYGSAAGTAAFGALYGGVHTNDFDSSSRAVVSFGDDVVSRAGQEAAR